MTELTKRIKGLRESQGMSQDELAKKLGYTSRSTIAKIESGENDINQTKIRAFAEALGTSTEYLLGLERKTTSRSLSELRIQAGYSLDDVSQKMHYPVENLKAWESGAEPTPPVVLLQMYEFYGIPGAKQMIDATGIRNSAEWDFAGITKIPTHPDTKIGEPQEPGERKLLGCYRNLNDFGKKEAEKRVEELTEIPKYTREKKQEALHIMPIAAHNENDSEEQQALMREDLDDL